MGSIWDEVELVEGEAKKPAGKPPGKQKTVDESKGAGPKKDPKKDTKEPATAADPMAAYTQANRAALEQRYKSQQMHLDALNQLEMGSRTAEQKLGLRDQITKTKSEIAALEGALGLAPSVPPEESAAYRLVRQVRTGVHPDDVRAIKEAATGVLDLAKPWHTEGLVQALEQSAPSLLKKAERTGADIGRAWRGEPALAPHVQKLPVGTSPIPEDAAQELTEKLTEAQRRVAEYDKMITTPAMFPDATTGSAREAKKKAQQDVDVYQNALKILKATRAAQLENAPESQ